MSTHPILFYGRSFLTCTALESPFDAAKRAGLPFNPVWWDLTWMERAMRNPFPGNPEMDLLSGHPEVLRWIEARNSATRVLPVRIVTSYAIDKSYTFYVGTQLRATRRDDVEVVPIAEANLPEDNAILDEFCHLMGIPAGDTRYQWRLAPSATFHPSTLPAVTPNEVGVEV